MTTKTSAGPVRRSLVLIAVGALAVTACGGDDDTADDTNTTEPAEPAEPAAEPETTEPAAEPETTEPAAEPETTEPAAEPETTEPAAAVEATIGIVNIAPVAALELVNQGFTEGMQECAGVDATIDYRNAEGDGSQLGPIVASFLDDDVDLILAISTPVLQAVVGANEADGRGTPVLFGAVTNPYAAGAAEGPDDKPDWLTGWQADAPVDGMFDIAEQIDSELSVIGVAFDPSQVNAEIAVGKMQAEADARGYTLETATIGDSSEVGTAANSLAGRDIDVFFVPTDSILVNGLAGMAQVADDFDIPMVAQDANIVLAGAAVGTGLDYLGDGFRNAEYACEILRGNATPADYPIQQYADALVKYSTANAALQGFEIPAGIAEVGVDQD